LGACFEVRVAANQQACVATDCAGAAEATGAEHGGSEQGEAMRAMGALPIIIAD